MKNKKMKLLAFIMMLAMLASTLLIPANAIVSKYDTVGKMNPLTLKEAGSAPLAYSATYATPAIDGVKDAAYGDTTNIVANHWSTGTADNGSSFKAYYVNDAAYLYFFIDVTLPTEKTKLTTADVARLYVDFYNQHDKAYYTQNNAYMTQYFETASTVDTPLANGGQFEYYAFYGSLNTTGNTKRGAKNLMDTSAVKFTYYFSDNTTATGVAGTYNSSTQTSTYNYNDKDMDRYTFEGRMLLPAYVSDAIVKGENPVISIGYEIRNTSAEPKFDMHYQDSSFKENTNAGTYAYYDYTVHPDVILATKSNLPAVSRSIADARGKTVTLDGKMDGTEGWSTLPFSILSCYNTGADLDKANNRTEFPELYMSADSENLYVFVDAKDTIVRTWFNLQLDRSIGRDTRSGAPDKWLQFIFNGTYHGKVPNQDPNNDRMSISYYNTSTSYAYSDNYTGSDYAFGGTQIGYSEDLSKLEIKIPMSDYMKQIISSEAAFKIDCLVSVYEGGGTNTIRLCDSLTQKYDWSNGTVPVTIPSYFVSADRTVADVNGKAVTIDGTKDENEGWATVPYSVLGKSYETKGFTSSNPELYLSADNDTLYVYVDGKQAIFESYFFVQLKEFEKGSSSGYDNFVQIRTCGTRDVATRGNRVNYAEAGNAGIEYSTTESNFANIEYAYNSTKTGYEIKIPLPEWAKAELRKDDLSFKVMALIRMGETSNKFDRVDSEFGASWNIGTIPVTLPKYKVNANVAIEGLQEKVIMDGNVVKATDVRFVSSLFDSYENYAELGYEFTYNGKTAVRNCNFVYEKLSSGDGFIEAGVGDFEDTQYFFCFTITGLTAGDYTFDVRAFTKANGESQANYSYKTTVSFTVEADGTVTLK